MYPKQPCPCWAKPTLVQYAIFPLNFEPGAKKAVGFMRRIDKSTQGWLRDAYEHAGAPDIKLPFVHAPTRVATAELRRQKLRLHKLRRSLLANEMMAQWVDTGNGRGGSGGVGRSGAMHPAVKAALSRAGEVGYLTWPTRHRTARDLAVHRAISGQALSRGVWFAPTRLVGCPGSGSPPRARAYNRAEPMYSQPTREQEALLAID